MVGPGKTYAPLGSALRRALSIASVRRGIGSLCSRPPFIRSGARINVADRKSISAHASRKASRKRNPVAASNSSACRCVPLSVLPFVIRQLQHRCNPGSAASVVEMRGSARHCSCARREPLPADRRSEFPRAPRRPPSNSARRRATRARPRQRGRGFPPLGRDVVAPLRPP